MRRLRAALDPRRHALALRDALRPRHLWRSWRVLGAEQRAAAAGAILLVVSTFGPFSWIEAAVVLVALSVLVLLYKRAQGRAFHLPFGDGGWVAAAGVWCGVLIVSRMLDRPVGQGLLALACAAILVLAGWRERVRRPPDDLPALRARLSSPRRPPAAPGRRR